MRLATIAPHARADDLDDDVDAGVAGGRAAEDAVGHRHDGVEVRARDRAECEDQRDQARAGRDRVLEQLRARCRAARGAARRCPSRRRWRRGTRSRRTRPWRARARSRSMVGRQQQRAADSGARRAAHRVLARARRSAARPGAISTSAEHRVDLPRLAIRTVDPHLVLHRVATRDLVLGRGGEAFVRRGGPERRRPRRSSRPRRRGG